MVRLIYSIHALRELLVSGQYITTYSSVVAEKNHLIKSANLCMGKYMIKQK